ncbi:MAG TPA: NUDIX domain-containing protein [Candidatus Portnoybacteria bacterium]|nr:NUDIX domain-containing protein [Candidatus Portnoybacteria bacterium]
MFEKKLLQTLGFFIKDGNIWLGVKIGGKEFGRGRLNGFGGDVNPGESIDAGMIRELREESGFEIVSMEKRAIIRFFFESEPDKVREVHVFWIFDCQGEPTGSEEMTTQQFSLAGIGGLFDRMWPSDRLWLPMFLSGKKFQGRVLYDNPENKKVIDKKFWEVESF